MKPWVHTEMRKRRNILDYLPRTEAKLRLEHVYLISHEKISTFIQGVLISMRIEWRLQKICLNLNLLKLQNLKTENMSISSKIMVDQIL